MAKQKIATDCTHGLILDWGGSAFSIHNGCGMLHFFRTTIVVSEAVSRGGPVSPAPLLPPMRPTRAKLLLSSGKPRHDTTLHFSSFCTVCCARAWWILRHTYNPYMISGEGVLVNSANSMSQLLQASPETQRLKSHFLSCTPCNFSRPK